MGVSRGAGDRLASGTDVGWGAGRERGGAAGRLGTRQSARCSIGALIWGQRLCVLVVSASEACWGSRGRPTFPRGLGGVRAAWGTGVSSLAPLAVL